ncbi:MAG: cell wall-binding repeat-containing protein, partial [Euzebyaceae bacterium]|nr:cell wall-binding repeat-containing protein [Euzebyaceae bacterium]
MTTSLTRARLAWMLALTLFLTGLAGAAPPPAQAHAACTVPFTGNIRGTSVSFDQCLDRAFTHNGTNLRIHVYYTENTTTNAAHALADADDAAGNNLNAVAVAAEAEAAFRFYRDRNLDVAGAGNDELIVLIGEDPRLGGVNYPNQIYLDDEAVDNNDVLNKRLLAFHEVMHLVQDKYDNGGVGWQAWYGEGIARAIEDRVDAPLDADTGHLFIPEVNGHLANDGERTGDFLSQSYRTVLWWTWLMDRYRATGEGDPVVGWQALRDFYVELNSDTNQLTATQDFIASRGSTFARDFIDYSLSLYTYRFNPADERLTYLDNEIRTATTGLSGHTVLTGGPAFGTVSATMNPRSSRYYEFNPASQCDYTSFTFNGNGRAYGFSVVTVDGGNLMNRWTSQSATWARTVRTADLDRIAGVVTSVDQSGPVTVGRGCVTPTINIARPTTAAYAIAGRASAPRRFIVRAEVRGQDGSAVAGLARENFTVQVTPPGGSPITANVLNAAYVQDDYWLLVQAPNATAGALQGEFHDLTVRLGTATDSESDALLYVERLQDTVIVLDRSGSMAEANKIGAARNAARLFTNELSPNDQGGYVAFDQDPYLRRPLANIGTGTNRADMRNAIAAETPGGATSIGDGMRVAAEEEAARGVSGNVCNFILLSDGFENSPDLWADVQAGVVDNGCAHHVVGLGPAANETLLQQIAAAGPGGSYDYADVGGGVPIGKTTFAQAGTLAWENNLSRVYDYKATRAAGRQRIFSAAGEGEPPPPIIRKAFQALNSHEFFVDDTSETLVVAVAWQGEQESAEIRLLDPDGNPVPDLFARFDGTNIVFEVPEPAAGRWVLEADMPQDYYVAASALTAYELQLFTGAPIATLEQGVEVPLIAMFAGDGVPLPGASVQATVTDPSGQRRAVTLFDDGNHDDGDPDDGVYAGRYTATSLGELTQLDPSAVTDGEEPVEVGSYLVEVRGVLDDIVREAQESFALDGAADGDGDGLPDLWETVNGLDPTTPDADGDADRDRLSNRCEFEVGTRPDVSDTDGGGEADGSEVAQAPAGVRCTLGDRDPFDPADDRIGPLDSVVVSPEAEPDGTPFIVVRWGPPERGELVSVDLYRRATDPDGAVVQDWTLIGDDLPGFTYIDFDVADGLTYAYEVVPTVRDADGNPWEGQAVPAEPVTASTDPYEPSGTVLINNGDVSTASTIVTLTLSADDVLPDEEAGPATPIPGTPTEDLEMRLSNTPDFADAEFEPFRPVVEGWDLGDVPPGGTATVYVQFRDAAGNVGSDGLGMVDTIVYDRQRFRGADRIETAAIIAESSFASAETALIARADNFPDALSGSYLAGQLDAPLLLTNTGSLPAATAEALADLGVRNVILLGGTAAISPTVEDALDDTYDVERIGGPDRYATAALIARRAGNVIGQLDGRPTAFVASGANFPDALVAGGPAYDQQFPLLLTPPGDVAAPTAEALDALGITQVIVPGGSAAVSEQVTDDLQGDGLEVIRVAGAERTQTAALLADFALERLGWTAMHANVARGDAFPDALAMG